MPMDWQRRPRPTVIFAAGVQCLAERLKRSSTSRRHSPGRAGTAVPFAIVRARMGWSIGSSRFWNLEYWAWPANHPSRGREVPDACEIGYTWLASSAIRTGANTEAKLLMLRHAFEVWQVLRVCFHTDARNQRSRAALERDWRQVRGNSSSTPDGSRLHSPRLGTLFHRCVRVARGENPFDPLARPAAEACLTPRFFHCSLRTIADS